MKHPITLLAGAILLLATAIPSMTMAQESMFGQKMNHFLNAHPDVASKVRADPSLLYSKQFREQHPELQTFMQNHPEVYTRLEQKGIHPGGFGAYDSNHMWRDSDWWHQHDPGWMYKNHPEWASNHPDWRADQTAHPEWFGHPAGGYEHPVGGVEHPGTYGTAPATGTVEQTNQQQHHHHHQQ
jgi:hypothetical protein